MISKLIDLSYRLVNSGFVIMLCFEGIPNETVEHRLGTFQLRYCNVVVLFCRYFNLFDRSVKELFAPGKKQTQVFDFL